MKEVEKDFFFHFLHQLKLSIRIFFSSFNLSFVTVIIKSLIELSGLNKSKAMYFAFILDWNVDSRPIQWHSKGKAAGVICPGAKVFGSKKILQRAQNLLKAAQKRSALSKKNSN